MNSNKTEKQAAILDKLAVITLVTVVGLAAIYALYTSNRIYPPIQSMPSINSHGAAAGLPMSPSPQTQPLDSSSVQLQSGAGAEQSSSQPPQNAANYNNYPPGCGSYRDAQMDMMCANPY